MPSFLAPLLLGIRCMRCFGRQCQDWKDVASRYVCIHYTLYMYIIIIIGSGSSE